MARSLRNSTTGAHGAVEDVTCVLFDLDGTLIDTIDMIRASMRYATEKVLGAALSDEVLMRNVGVPLRVQMEEFSAPNAGELMSVYREHNNRVHDVMLKEYPGVEEALTALSSKGLSLGVVTSKSRPGAFRGLERFGLERFFETVVTCDDVDRFKPDPFPLLRAAELLGVDISKCAYVGDSPHDMSAAVAAECVSIAALWGGFSEEVVLSPGPTYKAASMSDVVAILSGRAEEFLA
jgi:pyrophosphatase PpaX